MKDRGSLKLVTTNGLSESFQSKGSKITSPTTERAFKGETIIINNVTPDDSRWETETAQLSVEDIVDNLHQKLPSLTSAVDHEICECMRSPFG